MQLFKISGATAALLISMISASPIALTSDFIHTSGSPHANPTGSINHSFKIHPTGSFYPKESISTCTDDENPGFTIYPTGGKHEPHHYQASGTGVKSHKGLQPTGHISKSYASGIAKPTENIYKRDDESDIAESTTVSKTHRAKPTGIAAPEHQSGYAKPTGSGKKQHDHPSGTGVYKNYRPHESGYAHPTGTGHSHAHESGHAKASGKGGKEHHSGHAEPTGTGTEYGYGYGYAKATGVQSQKPGFTGTHEKTFAFKTETLTFGTKTFVVTGVVPEGTGKPLFGGENE